MFRSQGPDKLKSGYACYLQHNGVRYFDEYSDLSIGSGNYKILMDYNCCCDPCRYRKPSFEAAGNWKVIDSGIDYIIQQEHCCSCNPKAILVKWTPDSPLDPCDIYPHQQLLGYSTYAGESSKNTVKYEGTIAGHPIVVTLSPFDTTPSGVGEADGSGCRWTLHLAYDEYFENGYETKRKFIDHHSVTCLGVPTGEDVTFSGVTGFEGSGGSVSLYNYPSEKVAFVQRDLSNDVFYTQSNVNYVAGIGTPEYSGIYGSYNFDPATSGEYIPLPSSIISPGLRRGIVQPTGTIPLESECEYVPRYLCVKSVREYNGFELPIGEREQIKYREYIYDTGFFPIERVEFHPDYTGVENFTTGKALAKWKYTPINYSGANQLPADEQEKCVFLYETYTHNIPSFSGDAIAAQESGYPKYIMISIDNIADDQPNDVGARDTVWPGAGFLYHPLIHGGTGLIQYTSDGEDYYYNPGTASLRDLYLGGDLTSGSTVYGDGTACHKNISAVGGYEDFVEDFTDLRFIRAGRCSKWKYLCSDSCRCVPQNLCLFTAEIIRSPTTTTIGSHQLSWDGNSCWVGEGVSLCLESTSVGFIGEETYNGVCGLTLTGDMFSTGTYSYSFDTKVPIDCSWLFISQSFSDTIFDESGIAIASMIAETRPTFGDCSSRTSCDTASPCNINCGSHPESINIHIMAYSVSGEDEVSGGETPSGVCEVDFNMNYKETIIFQAEDPIEYYTLCYYETKYLCDSGYVDVVSYLNADETYAFLEFNGLSANYGLFSPFSKAAFDSYTESCNPYFFSGIIKETGPFLPFWKKYPCVPETTECEAFRMEIVITET